VGGLVGFVVGRAHASTRIVSASVFVAKRGDWTGREVPVVRCPNTGFSSPGRPRYPAVLLTSLDFQVAQQLQFYSDHYREVTPILGPAGWRCSASIGADGTTAISIFPPGVLNPQNAPNGTEETVGVTAQVIPVCAGCIASLVCPVFVNAEQQMGYGSQVCSGFEPQTESVRFLSGGPTTPYGIAILSDPPGDPGVNPLSGGDYPTVGVLGYSSFRTYPASPGAESLSCVLPPSRRRLCDSILNRFVYDINRGALTS
jgi:hypothetical protein